MNTSEQEIKEILEYQIEKIIREGTTYEFEIIDSPSVSINGEHFLARSCTIYRIKEHQLTSKFNSIREELRNRYDYETIDFTLKVIEYILTFLEEHKENRIFIMSESFNSGPDTIVGTFMGSKTIRAISI